MTFMRPPAARPQRRFPRLSCDHPIFVEVLADRGPQGFSRTRTLGEGGCSFKSPQNLGYLSLMKLAISVQGKVVNADGRVVYERPHDDGVEVGIEFLRLAPEDRLHIRALVASSAGGAAR
jgi:hypothetical protein